jgi:hypothetical protein
MNRIEQLFKGVNVVNVGIEMFKNDVARQGAPVVQLDWKPPGGGKPEVIAALDRLADPALAKRIDAANEEAVRRIVQSHPVLVGFAPALEVVPGMTKTTILHAGPPITWDKMNGAMRGAVTGALVFEGLARDIKDAEKVAASGAITFSPCHEHDCVGSMAGVTSASMYMHIVKNKTFGNVAFTNLSEQMAKILRMGANDESVITRLNWMRDVLGPMLAAAMKRAGEIDLRLLLSQALHMGDECHNRNQAGTLLLIQALTPHILETDFTTEQKRQVFDFVASSDYFSGPTWMALCKCAMDAAHGVPDSTIVTTMSRNGVEFGIRVSGMPGHHRNLRHRRLRHGDGAGDRRAGRRHDRRGHRLLHPHGGDHHHGKPERHHPAAELQGHLHRHRHAQGHADRHPAGDQHGHCPQGARHRHDRRRHYLPADGGL